MKKNKITFLLFCFAMALSHRSVFAQMGMGKIDEIEDVQKRPLIVMIEEPREKVLKKIAKKPKLGTVEDYKADLAKYNENVKAVVEKFWPYNKKGIQYMTYAQIKALYDKKSKGYAVLLCLSMKPSAYNAGYIYNSGLYWVKDIKEDFEDRNDWMFSSIVVNVIEDFGKKPVFHTPLYDVFPTKASLVYGIKTVESYFDLRIKTKKNGMKRGDVMDENMNGVAAKAPLLPSKTLLLREEWLGKDLTEANFGKIYPYPYKICDKEYMDDIIMQNDSTYAYGVELPIVISGSRSNTLVYVQYVLNAGDNLPMAMIRPSTGGMMLATFATGQAGTRNFTMKTMTRIVEQIKGISKAK